MDKDQENQQDELEKKISEAEMESQFAAAGSEQPQAAFEEEPTPIAPVKAPPEKKEMSTARKIWRRILIWLVIIAIFFAGGFYLDTYLRYMPAMDQVASLKSDLDDQGAEIASLQGEIDRLSQYEEENTDLREQVDQLQTHLKLLTARASVAEASLAVEQERISDARLALDKLGTTLESLKGDLNADQAEVVDSMLQRYRLIQNELGDEGYSAGTDLDLLANRLLALENNLFATP
jgi:hypothetical protein